MSFRGDSGTNTSDNAVSEVAHPTASNRQPTIAGAKMSMAPYSDHPCATGAAQLGHFLPPGTNAQVISRFPSGSSSKLSCSPYGQNHGVGITSGFGSLASASNARNPAGHRDAEANGDIHADIHSPYNGYATIRRRNATLGHVRPPGRANRIVSLDLAPGVARGDMPRQRIVSSSLASLFERSSPTPTMPDPAEDLRILTPTQANELARQLMREKNDLTLQHLDHVSSSERERLELENKLDDAERRIAELEVEKEKMVVGHEAAQWLEEPCEDEPMREEPDPGAKRSTKNTDDRRYFMEHRDRSFTEYLEETGLPEEPSYVQPQHEKPKLKPIEEKSESAYKKPVVLKVWQHNTEDGPVMENPKPAESDMELKNVTDYYPSADWKQRKADEDKVLVASPDTDETFWDHSADIAVQNRKLVRHLETVMERREQKIRAMEHHIAELIAEGDRNEERLRAKIAELKLLEAENARLRRKIATMEAVAHTARHDADMEKEEGTAEPSFDDTENRKPKQEEPGAKLKADFEGSRWVGDIEAEYDDADNAEERYEDESHHPDEVNYQ